jgi:formylglycine-generating enzyme required for sulfatase activity
MKQVISAVVVVGLLAMSANAQDQAVQWRVEDGGNGHWYQWVPYGSLTTWLETQVDANTRGGHLATVTSLAEDAFARSLFEPGSCQSCTNLATIIWIGGYQDRDAADFSEPAGGWRWVTGEPWSFTNWHPNEPNDFKGYEDFLGLTCNGSWNDGHNPSTCSTAAIIEWSADCNGDGVVDYGQILQGQLVDTNLDGVPDICEVDPCPADTNGNGVVNHVDLAAVLSSWGTDGQSEGDADTNNDGIVDGLDLTCVLGGWGPCINTPVWATVIEFAPDPAVVTNPTLRTAISATGLPWRVRDTATQIEFVLIPPGTFEMGCSPSNQQACQSDESPVHTVALTNAFYMGRYEVTQAQWTARMGSNPSFFQSSSAQVPASQVTLRPVEQVSWNTIQGFLSATGMRLPTEAEWEYAYRAGTATAYHSMPGYLNGTNDDSLVGNIAWFEGNAEGQTRPVGQLAGNGFGLHDMSGNVWEWVSDWHSPDYYASSPSVNPPGPPSGTHKVVRGGTWLNTLPFLMLRSSHRWSGLPEAFYYPFEVGFRVVRSP